MIYVLEQPAGVSLERIVGASITALSALVVGAKREVVLRETKAELRIEESAFEHTLINTGCTVILCPQGAVTGVDVRGGSPGTRAPPPGGPRASLRLPE